MGALFLALGCAHFQGAFAAELSPSISQSVDTNFKSEGHSSFENLKSPTHWALSMEVIALKRSNNSVNQPLVSTLPGTSKFGQTANMSATEAFNSNQFEQGSAAGPKLTLNYLGDSGYGLELSYFNVSNLNSSNTIGPSNAGNWYIMKAPGFWQTQDFAYQGMTWGSTTSLYSAEANAKFTAPNKFNFLAGFRWFQLKDSLTGSVTPADQNDPVWKVGGCAPSPSQISQTVYDTTLSQTTQACALGASIGGYPPFWSTNTKNNLLGLQLGAQGTIVELGRLSLGGSLKAGVFNNQATQSNAVSITKIMYLTSASTNQVAYSGEGVLQLKYSVTDDLSVKMGYQLLWLDRVALASGQIPYVYSGSSPTSVTARGVNAGSSILFQGGTFGLEYLF